MCVCVFIYTFQGLQQSNNIQMALMGSFELVIGMAP